MTPPICFVDTETTGLDPYYHEIWEVGLIEADGAEHHWFLPVDLARADPVALNIGRYHQRHPHGFDYKNGDKEHVFDLRAFAEDFAAFTWGKHLVGAVISFDEERLRRLLRRNHQAPGWHYHLIDVEALAVGYIAHSTTDPSAELRAKLGGGPIRTADRSSCHPTVEERPAKRNARNQRTRGGQAHRSRRCPLGESYLRQNHGDRLMPPIAARREWPLQPLLDTAGLTLHQLQTKTVSSGRAVSLANRHGCTVGEADRWAVRCGLHPSEVWDDWYPTEPKERTAP